eukprot:1138119-Pelagomonas_calceolata.AAC.9
MLPCLSILGLSGDQVPGKGLLWLCAPSAAPRRWPDIRPQGTKSFETLARWSTNSVSLLAFLLHPLALKCTYTHSHTQVYYHGVCSRWRLGKGHQEASGFAQTHP